MVAGTATVGLESSWREELLAGSKLDETPVVEERDKGLAFSFQNKESDKATSHHFLLLPILFYFCFAVLE